MHKKNDKSKPPSSQLRQNAEAALAQRIEIQENLSDSDTRKLLHELQVHQVELEMQNEELRQVESSRNQLHDRYVDLYDFAPVGYLTLNQQDLITEINLTAAGMLGEERKKLMLRRFPPLVATENRDECHRFLNYARQHAGRQSGELRMRRSDGTYFDARLDCLRVDDAERNSTVRIALTDITDRKRAEAQLAEQSQKLRDAGRRKDEFLAMLAHELRNPLAPIRNAVEILKFGDSDLARTALCAELIDRQVEHLIRLVDDLLDISRISRGLIELKTELLPIRDFILPAVETCQPLIDARRQQFSLALPRDDLWVEGDRIRLSQVVSNLLNNASKYTPEGGHIGLTAEHAGDDVSIRVFDNGCGVDPSELSSLFDLFYQAERSFDRSQGGLGIGLSLVHSMVAKHGGNVQAFSEGLGKGSEFWVRLPFRACPSSARVSKVSKVSNPILTGEKIRILVVDDNLDAAESLTLLLKTEGFEVLTAYEGLAALEMARVEHPDVMLLDIGLPGMDGYSVAREIRRRKEWGRPLLIAVTGYGRPEDKEKSKAAGFDEHLVKPVDIDTLLKLLVNHPLLRCSTT